MVETQPVEVVIDKIPKYELLAPVFLQMEKNGASVVTIASAHKVCWQYAKEILDFAKTGKRPKWHSGNGDGTGQARPAKYPDIEKDAAYLRDVKKLPFEKIAAQLGVGVNTAYRAYDSAHQDEVRKAAECGKKPNRGRWSILGEEKYQMIRKMIRKGKSTVEIAAKVGCGASTVRRVRRQMQIEPGGD